MRNNDIAIEVANLGKCYHIFDKPLDRLKQAIFRNKKQYYREFWALEDVSFTLKKGEALGIIGRNGSGKSTLLQMLCQTLQPTQGSITFEGRVAALLELGAGFNPQFTGRENVYLNGAILGFSQHQMNQRIDEILTFAEIGDFIDQPVKTYSSGMFVRLAFAVQACVDPDILIIDEALSVGDVFFQQKCAKRMQQLRDKGTSLIFVSHDMGTVRDLCENALYLKSGKLVYSGTSIEAIRRYFVEACIIEDASIQKSLEQPVTPLNASVSQIIDEFKASACWTADISETINTKEAHLVAIAVFDQNNTPTLKTVMTKKLKFRVLYQASTEAPVHVTLSLRNRHDHIIHVSGTYTHNTEIPILKMGEYAIFEIDMSCMIEAGSYTFSIALGKTMGLINKGIAIDESPWLGPLTITWDYEKDKAPWMGMFGIPSSVSILKLQENNIDD